MDQPQADQAAAAGNPEDSDDLIFSGSGCYDDEDECANYADSGSGSDDLITPVYVPAKPTASNAPPPARQRPTTGGEDKRPHVMRACPPHSPDDDDDDDDDDDEDDCGSGDLPAAGADSSAEATERPSLNVDLPAMSTRNPIEDYDDRSILFTSHPIPPPAIEEPGSGFIPITTRKPTVLAKRPNTGPTELVKLPLPPQSLPSLPGKHPTAATGGGLNRKPAQAGSSSSSSGTGHLQPSSDLLDNSADDDRPGLVRPYDSLSPLDSLEEHQPVRKQSTLGGIIVGGGGSGSGSGIGGGHHINLNFTKRSADRTVLVIILIAVGLILALILVYLLVALRARFGCCSKTAKYASAPTKSFSSLVAAGPAGGLAVASFGTLSRCQTPAQLGYAPVGAGYIAGSMSSAHLAGMSSSAHGDSSKSGKLHKKKDPREWYV